MFNLSILPKHAQPTGREGINLSNKPSHYSTLSQLDRVCLSLGQGRELALQPLGHRQRCSEAKNRAEEPMVTEY